MFNGNPTGGVERALNHYDCQNFTNFHRSPRKFSREYPQLFMGIPKNFNKFLLGKRDSPEKYRLCVC